MEEHAVRPIELGMIVVTARRNVTVIVSSELTC